MRTKYSCKLNTFNNLLYNKLPVYEDFTIMNIINKILIELLNECKHNVVSNYNLVWKIKIKIKINILRLQTFN